MSLIDSIFFLPFQKRDEISYRVTQTQYVYGPKFAMNPMSWAEWHIFNMLFIDIQIQSSIILLKWWFGALVLQFSIFISMMFLSIPLSNCDLNSRGENV